MASYSDPYAGVNLEESSRIAAGGTPFVQREVDAEEARKQSHERIASEVSDQLGIPTSKALELVTAQYEADKAQKLAKIDDSIKQAGYSKDLAQMRQYISNVDLHKVGAQDKIDEISQKWSYLAGADNPQIVQQYQSNVDMANKRHTNWVNTVRAQLPRGVALEQVKNEDGTINYDMVNEIAAIPFEKRQDYLEAKQGRQLKAKTEAGMQLIQARGEQQRQTQSEKNAASLADIGRQSKDFSSKYGVPASALSTPLGMKTGNITAERGDIQEGKFVANPDGSHIHVVDKTNPKRRKENMIPFEEWNSWKSKVGGEKMSGPGMLGGSAFFSSSSTPTESDSTTPLPGGESSATTESPQPSGWKTLF
jgi:hypothetical protein